jgi:hypothetical protein
MGADIHLYVERKTENGWEAVKGKNPDIERYQTYAKTQRERGDETQALDYEKRAKELEDGTMLAKSEDEYDRTHYAPEVYQDWIYDGRNYDLFAILADVRNGRGFAGSYTGEGFNPIADTKGVPDDMSDVLKEAYEYWEGDGHSHSWFTVKELTEYDWEQKTVTLKSGLYDMRTSLEELKNNTEEASYKDCVGSFYTDTIPKLKELADNDLDSVRIVFWFDN